MEARPHLQTLEEDEDEEQEPQQSMEARPPQEPQGQRQEEEEEVEVKQKDYAQEKDVKHPISISITTSSPPPAMASSPPSSSSIRHPTTRDRDGDDDDTDSPPHPIDSPSSSSLSSGHCSISRLSSPTPRDQAALAITSVERAPSTPPSPSPSPPSVPVVAAVSVKRSVRDGPPPAQPVLEKVDQVVMDGGPAARQWAEEAPTTPMAGGGGGAGAGGGGGGGRGGRRLRPDLSILRRARRESMMRRVQLVARIFGCLFCLVACSVLAADKDQGWAVDSFYRYKEFRFCLAVNAIGFVYSGLQACDLAYISATGKHLAQHRLRPFLDFSLDQALSYLLISATSSAATRVEDWQMNWGKDKFPQMATASVAFTVLAFISFALSSVISFYTLSTVRSL